MYRIWNRFVGEFCKANNVPVDFSLNRRFRRERYSCSKNGGIVLCGITPENKVVRYKSIYDALDARATSKVQVYGIYAHGVIPISNTGPFLELLWTISYACDCLNFCIPTDDPFTFSSWAFSVPRLNIVYSRLCFMKQILTATKSDKLSVCYINDPSYYSAHGVEDMNKFIRDFLNIIKDVFISDVCEKIKTMFGLIDYQETYFVYSHGVILQLFSPYDKEYWGNRDGRFLTVQPYAARLRKDNPIDSEDESTKKEKGYLCRLNGFMFYAQDWDSIINGLASRSNGLVPYRPDSRDIHVLVRKPKGL